jgi:sugar phosphate permease
MDSRVKPDATIETFEDVNEKVTVTESVSSPLHPDILLSHLSKDDRKILDDPEAMSAWKDDYVPGSEQEKRMVRKIDIHMLPILWFMYIFNYIDRTNIGNAKVAGLEVDLHMETDPNKYSLALLIFFVGYILLEVPSNMILPKVRPSIYLPFMMIVWGCMTIIYMGVRNLGGLVALRFFLGVVESGFFPGKFLIIKTFVFHVSDHVVY